MTYEDILQFAGGGATIGNLAVRVNEKNPNHHLWNNRGTWWCHFTLHYPDYTSERIRVSLKTNDVEEARSRRDELLDAVR
ncbi:MAG: hypothetical protein HKN23_20530 [Verrucomicrobiales bacterium]|nr:hypothetical protein [Verrucomicrobiales bacterium]